MHLEYLEPDDSVFNLDVDVNPPTPYVKNIKDYDGTNEVELKSLLNIRLECF